MIEQAVILCGGLGTRLKKIASLFPKVMVPVGHRPLLEDQIVQLKEGGVGRVILCTGYMSKEIENHFGNGSRLGISISYSREETALGTAGAVRNIHEELNDDFFVVYGDVFFRMDIKKLALFHEQKKASATAVLHRSTHPVDSDVVDTDREGRMISFSRRKVEPGENVLTNAALLVLNRSFLSMIEQGKKLDFSLDVFPRAIKKIPCYGYVTDEYVFDVGTEERYMQLVRDLEKGI